MQPDPHSELRSAVMAAHEGRRPPLSPDELANFARLIRPDVECNIEIVSNADGPMILVRAVKRPPSSTLLSRLSSREREVAVLISRGLTNPEIGRELGIQTSTVKDHVHEILQQLGFHSRQQLVAEVVREMERSMAAETRSGDAGH